MSAPRKLRPRATAALVVAPIAVTKRSAPAVLGVDSPDFHPLLDLLGVKHVHKGHQVIALVADIEAALERASTKSADDSTAARTDSTSTNVDDLLARIGRRRSA